MTERQPKHTQTRNRLTLLLAHSNHRPGVDRWYREIAEAAPENLVVRCFPMTTDPAGGAEPRLEWPRLEQLWQRHDERLMRLYAKLRKAAADCDVLLNYTGTHLHPDFVQCLPTFNVFACFDDPESSAVLSEPTITAYDAAFHGNRAAEFHYRAWGITRLAWLPVFTAPSDVPPRHNAAELLAAKRDVPVVLACDKHAPWRRRRVETLQAAFATQCVCVGDGWPGGRVSESELHALYRRAQIGWNIHHSTGPVNRRTFALLAFGVLQIADNKTGLGHILRLNDEVVGFDTISEATALTHYFLDHPAEAREIATAGYQRFWRDYHAAAIWRRIADQLWDWGAERRQGTPRVAVSRPSGVAGTVGNEPVNTKLSCRGAVTNSLLVDERVPLGEVVAAYHENPEQRGVNWAKERLARGHPLEWPNIAALNWAVCSLLGPARRIVEIGSGTGAFADFASVDPRRELSCFEFDDFARQYAMSRCSRPNVRFHKDYPGNLQPPYDVVVSIEVVEHVANTAEFLRFCHRLAPRAIFTTPNRRVLRGVTHIGPPPYPPHVREFTPGEIYWLLRQHYTRVHLFQMPNVFVPWLTPMTVADDGTPVIALCDR